MVKVQTSGQDFGPPYTMDHHLLDGVSPYAGLDGVEFLTDLDIGKLHDICYTFGVSYYDPSFADTDSQGECLIGQFDSFDKVEKFAIALFGPPRIGKAGTVKGPYILLEPSTSKGTVVTVGFQIYSGVSSEDIRELQRARAAGLISDSVERIIRNTDPL